MCVYVVICLYVVFECGRCVDGDGGVICVVYSVLGR